MGTHSAPLLTHGVLKKHGSSLVELHNRIGYEAVRALRPETIRALLHCSQLYSACVWLAYRTYTLEAVEAAIVELAASNKSTEG